MIFKNYCLVLLGKFDKELAFEELSKISEIKINFIYTTGVYIASFSTIMTPKEMKNLLKICKNNCFIFELSDEVSCYNLEDKEIEAGLFKLLEDVNLDEMSKNFIQDLEETPKDIVHELTFKKGDIVKYVNTLTEEDKETLMNTLIDKGVDKLTELDKKILNLLSK